jgi:glycosyltransferase involved in cell wall biosynthesis
MKRVDPFLASLVLRQGNGHIVLTKNEKERLLSLVSPTAPIKVCTHPKYDVFTKQRISKQEARKKLDLPEDMPILLFFGIVRPYKGVEYFVQSLSHLIDKDMEVYALIVGEWWMDQTYSRDLILDSGLVNRVRIVDRYVPNDEVGYYFSAADVFIAPYVGGTQSGSVKIALAFDLAMIVTEHIADGIQEADPDQLYVVPIKDSVGITDAVERHLKKKIGIKKSVEHTQDHGDWEALYQAIHDLVGSVRI